MRTEHRVTDSLSLSWTVATHPHNGYNRNYGLEEPGKPDVKRQMTEYLGTIDNVCLRPPRVGATEHSMGVPRLVILNAGHILGEVTGPVVPSLSAKKQHPNG